MLMKRNTVVGWIVFVHCFSTVALADEVQKEYLAVLLNGKKVGYAQRERTVANEQVTTTEMITITIARMGIPLTVKQSEVHVETVTGKPLRFESVQDMSLMTSRTTGQINDDGQVEISKFSMGQQQTQTLAWPIGAVLAEGLRLEIERRWQGPQKDFEVTTYAPSLIQALTMRISIGKKQSIDLLGRVLSLTEVKTRYNMPGAGEIETTSFVDDQLRPQKTVMPLMSFKLELVACAEAFAMAPTESIDLVDQMLVQSPVQLKRSHDLKSITYQIRPTNEQGKINLPSTDNQTVTTGADGRMTLIVRPVEAPAGVSFPYQGTNPNLLDALKSYRYVQADHPEVKKLAQQAIGKTRDAAEAVSRIEAFVADYISNKSLSVGYASAAEVIVSKQGDCTEHAVLTAAMCRAVGIPAQVVVGIAYVEEFSGRQHVFGGHAWTRAYIKDRWVGFDAAFKGTGRGGYDPGHITMGTGNGEPADFFGLLGSFGQFEIESLTVEK